MDTTQQDIASVERHNKAFSFKWIVLAVIVVILGVAGFIFRSSLFPAKPAPKVYSAVFLTNQQVYFGQIGNIGDKFLTLTGIYYFQVNASSTPTLVKLGNELHQPKDSMHINLDQVIFTEELRSDSQVVKAINTK